MAYLQSNRGDYLAGYQGGLPILGAIGGSLLKRGVSWLGSKLSGKAGKAAVSTAVGVGIARNLPQLPHVGVPMPGGGTFRPTALMPGGTPAYTPGPGQIPRGYRLNKSGYHLKDGTYIAPGTKLVKVRTRNFANGKALNKSISRVQGFERLVKRSRKSLRSLSRI